LKVVRCACAKLNLASLAAQVAAGAEVEAVDTAAVDALLVVKAVVVVVVVDTAEAVKAAAAAVTDSLI
jgi:hypothetical protein